MDMTQNTQAALDPERPSHASVELTEAAKAFMAQPREKQANDIAHAIETVKRIEAACVRYGIKLD